MDVKQLFGHINEAAQWLSMIGGVGNQSQGGSSDMLKSFILPALSTKDEALYIDAIHLAMELAKNGKVSVNENQLQAFLEDLTVIFDQTHPSVRQRFIAIIGQDEQEIITEETVGADVKGKPIVKKSTERGNMRGAKALLVFTETHTHGGITSLKDLLKTTGVFETAPIKIFNMTAKAHVLLRKTLEIPDNTTTQTHILTKLQSDKPLVTVPKLLYWLLGGAIIALIIMMVCIELFF